MKIGTPIVIVMLPATWFYLIKYFKIDGDFAGGKEVINHEIKLLGKFSSYEKECYSFLFLQQWDGFSEEILN